MATATDPTIAAVASLSDPSKWTVIRDVPVFDEHDEYDGKGKLKRRFDRAKLQQIADHCNTRDEATGSLTLIGPGHTLQRLHDRDGKPLYIPKEGDQPLAIGVACNWRVGTFGPKNRIALLCDHFIRKDKYADYLSYPRRSVELWYDRNDIDWIACKRAATERDLGLVTDLAPPNLLPVHLAQHETASAFEREADQLLCYELGQYYAGPLQTIGGGAQPSTMEATAMLDQFMRKLEEHPAWKHLCSQYEAHCKASTPATGPSAPASGNTYTPDDKLRMEREQEAIRYARIEKDVAEVKAANKSLAEENAKLRLDYLRQARERDLVQLEAEGYEFDRAKALTALEALPDDAYKARLDEMRQYYRKGPSGDPIRIRQGNSEGGVRTPAMDRQRMERIVSHASATGKTFDEAMKEVN